jgi:hypothetical protein
VVYIFWHVHVIPLCEFGLSTGVKTFLKSSRFYHIFVACSTQKKGMMLLNVSLLFVLSPKLVKGFQMDLHCKLSVDCYFCSLFMQYNFYFDAGRNAVLIKMTHRLSWHRTQSGDFQKVCNFYLREIFIRGRR